MLGVVGAVSSFERQASAQVTVGGGAIIEGGDPTPINGPFCATHVMPPNSPVIPLDSGLGLTENPLGTLTPGYSWAAAAPTWAKDRRPLAVFQMSSAGYTNNPRGNVDWWWLQTDGPSTFQADDARDFRTPRPLSDGIQRYDLIGNVEDGNQTAVPNGIPEAFDVMIRRIKVHADNGFRRFVLHLPGGTLGTKEDGFGPPCNGNGISLPKYTGGGTTQSMNQYVAMPQWKREYFTGFVHLNGQPTTQLNAWGEFVRDYVSTSPDTEPDRISLEVYIGGSLSGAGDHLNLATEQTAAVTVPPLWDGGQRPADSFVEWDALCEPVTTRFWTESRIPAPITLIPIDPRVESHMRLFWMQIKPWVAAGFRTVWLDDVTANSLTKAQRWGFLELARNPYLRSQGIRLGGEAFPFSDVGNNSADDCALAVTRWFANSPVLYWSCSERTFRCDLTNRRTSSEVHFLANCGGPPMSAADYDYVRSSGYVLSFYTQSGPDGKVLVEQAKRWYSMGRIQVADFDGENGVTPADRDAVYAIIAPFIANPNRTQPDICVFANGDIDGNGFVDANDWTFFESKWNPDNNQRSYAPDYGGPDDL
ncbi:MAG: hypothetical protein SFZ23_13180 [Planctomycetota bacterium]|nr:hypothetical protein [Planctomycetota bacterium]